MPRSRRAVNKGIVVERSTVSGSQLATEGAMAIGIVGTASVELERRGQQEIASRLAELQQALLRHGDQLSNREEVLGAVAEVAGQLRAERPNKLTVTGILNSLAGGVQSVAGLATAVEALSKAVHAFL